MTAYGFFTDPDGPRVAPAEGDIVICKTASGVFCSADTDSILRNNGVARLVFAGGLTDACVSSSVREGFDRGYLCTVAEDAQHRRRRQSAGVGRCAYFSTASISSLRRPR